MKREDNSYSHTALYIKCSKLGQKSVVTGVIPITRSLQRSTTVLYSTQEYDSFGKVYNDEKAFLLNKWKFKGSFSLCMANTKTLLLWLLQLAKSHKRSLCHWKSLVLFLYPSFDNVFLLQRKHHVSEIPSHVLPMTSVQGPVKENQNQICLSNSFLESVLIILMQKTVNCYWLAMGHHFTFYIFLLQSSTSFVDVDTFVHPSFGLNYTNFDLTT